MTSSCLQMHWKRWNSSYLWKIPQKVSRWNRWKLIFFWRTCAYLCIHLNSLVGQDNWSRYRHTAHPFELFMTPYTLTAVIIITMNTHYYSKNCWLYWLFERSKALYSLLYRYVCIVGLFVSWRTMASKNRFHIYTARLNKMFTAFNQNSHHITHGGYPKSIDLSIRWYRCTDNYTVCVP